ncbi:hypothetical protein [Pseudoclavibacter sp. VKM Ac-2888]|uniref:hypothetical protein n=1 Tax=Pseudoclavibacter sp. VKM Ac-2888 TaxID=2783830 RepID=UPI00188A564C|nr:hypothetical protein [Pseudoclavibacter sp. VKM Ac-2888]MBF4549243.1 hypothetical protein [Pseudoclavibacter sp. VKM Ac-2888]
MRKHFTPVIGFRSKFDVMGIRYMTDAGDGSGQQAGAAGVGGGDGAQGADGLGDAGKQAIERMKGERNAAQSELKAFTSLGLSADDLKALVQANQDKSADKIREQATKEANDAANERLHNKLRSNELRTQAAVLGFNDPNDVGAFLTAEQIAGLSVSDADEVDGAAAKALLEALAKSKPYLVKDTVTDSRTAGIGSVGSGGGATNVQPGRSRIAAAIAASK